MRSYIVLLLFVASFCGASAQTLLAEFPAIEPKIQIDDLLLAYGTDGSMGICYSTADKLVVRVLDKDGKTVYQQTPEDDLSTLLPIGSLEVGDAYRFMYYNEDLNGFTAVTASKMDSQEVGLSAITPFDEKDKYIGSLIAENEFYTIAWDKKRHLIRFGSYDKAAGQFNMKEHAMSDALMKRLDKAEIASISETTIPEPSLAASNFKLYRNIDGRIAITIEGGNKERCKAEVLMLDPESGHAVLLPIGGPAFDEMGNEANANTYIYNGHLALVSPQPGMLEISFYKLEDLSLVRRYLLDENNIDSLMNSILYNESYNDPFVSRSLSQKSNRILRKLCKGTPFLYCEDLPNGDLAFTIGNTVTSNSGAGRWMPGAAGSSISTPYGSIPGVGTPGVFMPYGESYDEAMYFHTIMSKPDFEHLSGEAATLHLLSMASRKFIKDSIKSPSSTFFSVEPEYQLLQLPKTQAAILISYIKKEGVLKIHKIGA